MAKTFDFNAIKGIRLVDKSGKVKDEAVKSKLGDQNLFRFKDGIVWAKPFKLTIPSLPQGVKSLSVKRTSTKRSLATNGELSDGDDIYYNDTLTVETKPSIGYYPPTLNATAITVEDNHTVSVQAGDTYDWAVIIPPLAEGFSSFVVKNDDELIYATNQEQIVEFNDRGVGHETIYFSDVYESGVREHRVAQIYPNGFVCRTEVISSDNQGYLTLRGQNKIRKLYFMSPSEKQATSVGFPETPDYVDTIYFNTALSKERVIEIIRHSTDDSIEDSYVGLFDYWFFSGGALPTRIFVMQDHDIFTIKGEISLSNTSITEYTYFDSINGWSTDFKGFVEVKAKNQTYVTDDSGQIVALSGAFNEKLTELISATNTFDDFSQAKWD